MATEIKGIPQPQDRQRWVAARVECLSELAYTVTIMSNDGSLNLEPSHRACIDAIVTEVVKLFRFEDDDQGVRRLRLFTSAKKGKTRTKKRDIELELHSCITTLQLLSKTLV